MPNDAPEHEELEAIRAGAERRIKIWQELEEMEERRRLERSIDEIRKEAEVLARAELHLARHRERLRRAYAPSLWTRFLNWLKG